MKKLCFLLLCSLQMTAQEFSVQKGVVMDSISVSDTLSEEFALYLPSSYETGKKYPVLLLFDGQGRGKTTAHLFSRAAERQGYILVSSNDINPEHDFLSNAQKGVRLLNRVLELGLADLRQISVSGSNGGAKVATSIPLIYKNIHGVIAVGDQWVNFDLVDRKRDFYFIGVVGDEQFTSAEMNLTAEIFEELEFPSTVYVYEGQDDWPEPALISSAVGSLTLQAMREGLRPADQELVRELSENDMGLVDMMISNGRLLNAFDLLEIMEEKYRGFLDTDAVDKKMDQLQDSRNFREQRRDQREVLEKERRLMSDFVYYLYEDVRTENFENLGWWNYQKNQLDSLAAGSGPESRMAERLKGFIPELARMAIEDIEKEKGSLESRLIAHIIRTIFDPRAFDSYKKIISLSAMDNDFGTALFYLEEMLKHGYRDKEALYEIEGTLGLKLTQDYNKIIERYFGSAKNYDHN